MLVKFLSGSCLAFFSLIYPSLASGQPFAIGANNIQNLGSVQIKDTTVGVLIAFGRDNALLAASIANDNSSPKYIPLFSSTNRGLGPLTLKVMVSKSNNEIWFYFNSVDMPEIKGVWGYYKIGSETAATNWGTKPLLDTPYPKSLSGGGSFPKFDQNDVTTLATFYYYGEESSAPKRKNGW